MFIPYVSTAFVPASTMPAVLRVFARHQPFTPVIETLRAVWMGHTSTGVGVGHEALLAVVYLPVILVGSALGSGPAVLPADRRIAVHERPSHLTPERSGAKPQRGAPDEAQLGADSPTL